MTPLRGIALTFVLSVLAAALGVVGGVWLVAAHDHHPASLHQVLHEQLLLTAQQEQRIEVLERDYAAKRKALEAEMRAANAQLAQAYQEGHAYTPQVQAAIDRFHVASDALQKQTMIHVAAMRAVLAPGQAATFDETVVRSLNADGS